MQACLPVPLTASVFLLALVATAQKQERLCDTVNQIPNGHLKPCHMNVSNT